MSHVLIERFPEQLNWLTLQSDESFIELVGKLRKMECRLYPEDDLDKIVRQFDKSEIQVGQVSEITRLLITLYVHFTEQHNGEDKCVATIVAAYLSTVSNDNGERLASRLTELLACENLLVSIKATNLDERSGGSNLLATKHIADLRPVFVKRSISFEHAIIQQSSFFTVRNTEGVVSELCFTLDDEQIDKLIEDLVESKSKIQDISQHCKKHSITLIPSRNV